MKKSKKKRRAKRILGNDRFLMMLCRDARRRWMQYGENRKNCKSECPHKGSKEVDHIIPLGPRPRAIDDTLIAWLIRMVQGECELLCKTCHKNKTDKERKLRKSCHCIYTAPYVCNYCKKKKGDK